MTANTEAVAAVRAEREARGWSVRHAAQVGGITNTHWAAFEAGTQRMTPRIARAVATAFDWPEDWSAEPPTEIRTVLREVAELRRELATVQQLVAALARQQLDAMPTDSEAVSNPSPPA